MVLVRAGLPKSGAEPESRNKKKSRNRLILFAVCGVVESSGCLVRARDCLSSIIVGNVGRKAREGFPPFFCFFLFFSFFFLSLSVICNYWLRPADLNTSYGSEYQKDEVLDACVLFVVVIFPLFFLLY